MRPYLILASLFIVTLLVMCKQPDLPENSSLRHYTFGEDDGNVMKLNMDLEEISGLAMLPDSNLVAHDDEKGIVYVLDPLTGDVLSSREIGDKLLRKDFEGIALAGTTLYIVTSDGTLYRLKDKGNKWYDYDEIHTGLNQRNDIEGLCYDPNTDCLLLACKEHPGEGHSGYRAVYAYSLQDNALIEMPRLLIKASEIAKHTPELKFNPSGIEYHPKAGTFYILASHGNTLIEVTRDGVVLGQVNLPRSIHRQPEGITLDDNGNLYISNEADGKHPTLIRYESHSQ